MLTNLCAEFETLNVRESMTFEWLNFCLTKSFDSKSRADRWPTATATLLKMVMVSTYFGQKILDKFVTPKGCLW